MTARSLVRALAFAGALLLPLIASATVVMELTVEEMTARAALVVRGTVQGSKAVQVDGSIWTLTTITVTEKLKGAGTARITVKQPGGVVAGIRQAVSGTARFTEGDDVVLFLEPTNEAQVYLVQGLAAGSVSLEVINGQKSAVRHLDGLGFARAGSQRVQRVENLDRLGSADAFLERVRGAARNKPTPPATRGAQ